MITIIDYGMGNLGSIANMLKKIGRPCQISADPAEIVRAERMILPGVGAFDTGMSNIRERGLESVLRQKALEEKIPTLGICLGMQLLTRGSEEGQLDGLAWMDADTVRFRCIGQKIPHMGWNYVEFRQPCALSGQLPEEPRFYFVHSYHVVCDSKNTILAETEYGGNFTSITQQGNILGAQFHPEKSHKFGMAFLNFFAEWQP